jgi:hypothetical protein
VAVRRAALIREFGGSYISDGFEIKGAKEMAKQPTRAASASASKTAKKNRFWELLRKLIDAKLLFSLLALLVALYAFVFHRADVEISFNEKGATIITRGSQVRKAIVLLPANKPWLNTGIDVVKGQKVTLTASGSVNLAIHRLVNSAQTHERPRLGWLGPDGAPQPYPDDLDNARNPYLIAPNLNYGTVLACVAPEVAELRPGITNPRPPGVRLIGRGGSFTAESDGKLWIVVNDVILNEKSENAYVAKQGVLDKVYGTDEVTGRSKVTEEQKKKEWDTIKGVEYYDAFFDDNAGEFLIQIDFTK